MSDLDLVVQGSIPTQLVILEGLVEKLKYFSLPFAMPFSIPLNNLNEGINKINKGNY